MLKLNDDNIFIGEIKQILKNFNLPDCYIGEEKTPLNQFFIENNIIYFKERVSNQPDSYKLTEIGKYIYNKYYPNLTKNFKINNLLYDRVTHRYLGNYLRFLKYKNGIDLLSMFNCFDQDPFTTTLNEKMVVKNSGDEDFIIKTKLNNSNYSLYKIPIEKLSSKVFSIYLQSSIPIECCLFISNYIEYSDDKKTVQVYGGKLLKSSYKKLSISKNYILDYRNLFKTDNTLIYSTENNFNIYLLVNIPKNLKSCLTILDGDYISNRILKNFIRQEDDNYIYGYSYNINPQLASYENNQNYLLADKLIEYLTENAITPQSEDYDIKKVQNYLFNKYIKRISDNELPEFNLLRSEVRGYWSETDTLALNQTIIDIIKGKDNIELSSYYDRLSYVDKDIESIMISGNNDGSMDSYEKKQFN